MQNTVGKFYLTTDALKEFCHLTTLGVILELCSKLRSRFIVFPQPGTSFVLSGWTKHWGVSSLRRNQNPLVGLREVVSVRYEENTPWNYLFQSLIVSPGLNCLCVCMWDVFRWWFVFLCGPVINLRLVQAATHLHPRTAGLGSRTHLTSPWVQVEAVMVDG